MADLDIEEVNRVRQSLGMAPLPTSNSSRSQANSKAANGEPPAQLDYLDEQHAAAGDNWKKLNDEAEAKKRREAKRALLKKEREAAQRSARLDGRGLGDVAEGDEQDTRSWLLGQKKRKKKIDKTRARALEQELRQRENQKQYTEKDLVGARVGHDLGDFEDGEQILTLKDVNVEDDDEEDELENATLREKEKLKERLELKKKRTVYNPLDQEGEHSLLSQYDEEIDGKKKGPAFTLGDVGSESASRGRRENDPDVPPRTGQVFSLDDFQDDGKPVSDYLDLSEIKVKKPKKKKDKSKSRKRLEDEELDPESAGEKGSQPKDEAAQNERKRRRDEDLFADDDDLQLNLAAQRRAALKKRKVARPEDLARQLREEASDDAMEDDSTKGLVIDETSEFVANLKKPDARPERRKSPPRFESASKQDDEDDHAAVEHGEDGDVRIGENPSQVDSVSDAQGALAAENQLTETGLDEEGTFTGGVGAALSMLQGRGLIKTADSGDLNAQYRDRQRFLAERQQREEEAEQRARYQRKQTRESGHYNSLSAQDRQVREKQDNDVRAQADSRRLAEAFDREYKPSIELKYVDDFGRHMNRREAFKHLSHQFHGKGSGKKKTEKKLKKIEDEKKQEAKSALDGSGGSGMGNAANVTQKKNRQAGVRLQ